MQAVSSVMKHGDRKLRQSCGRGSQDKSVSGVAGYVADAINMPLTSYPFTEILPSLARLLDQAAYLLNRGIIDPQAAIRSTPHGP